MESDLQLTLRFFLAEKVDVAKSLTTRGAHSFAHKGQVESEPV